MRDDLKYWLAISQNTKMGQVKISKLLAYFNSMEEAWQAPVSQLVQAGIEEKIAQELAEQRKNIDPREELAKLQKLNIEAITYLDKGYPKLLREIYSPPAVLYVKGNLLPEDEIAVGIVGTRKPTNYGKQAAYEISYNLAHAGITIVSGLALGIDGVAHRAALEARGRTIAILACGLDKIYPFSHKDIANQIIENGAIVSEFPIGMPALAYNFPQRNRIIAGLSLGSLVVEAPESSGALITAQFAIDQNREVFALPGSIYSKESKGPNNLIKQGAKIITGFKDILDELNLGKPEEFIESRKIIPESKEEEIILPLLSKEPIHIDEIIKRSNISSSSVLATLTTMEMKGKVKNTGNSNYIVN